MEERVAARERVNAEEVGKPGKRTGGSLKDGRRLGWMTTWRERQKESYGGGEKDVEVSTRHNRKGEGVGRRTRFCWIALVGRLRSSPRDGGRADSSSPAAGKSCRVGPDIQIDWGSLGLETWLST